MNAHSSEFAALFDRQKTAASIEAVIRHFSADLEATATLAGTLREESLHWLAHAAALGVALAQDAVRAGRLIDFGATALRCCGPFVPSPDTAHRFGGETAAYSIVAPAGELRSRRLVFALDPRLEIAVVVEVAVAGGQRTSHWIATAIGDEVFAERHGLGERINPACCARSLAARAAVSTLHPISGWFHALSPQPGGPPRRRARPPRPPTSENVVLATE
jgi:hypothetical protein